MDQNMKPAGTAGYGWTGSGFFRFTSQRTFPEDTFELFAFCIEARSKALGAQNGVAGKFILGSERNLDAAPFGFGEEPKGHSGQFRSNNMKRAPFYDQIMIDLGVRP